MPISVKMLEKFFKFDHNLSLRINAAIRNFEARMKAFPGSFFSGLKDGERFLVELEEILKDNFNSCGVETIADRNGNVLLKYINTGGNYSTTFLFYPNSKRIYYGAWEDFVETYEKKHGRLS